MVFVYYKLQGIANYRLAHLRNLADQFILLRTLLTNKIYINTYTDHRYLYSS